MKPFKEFLNLQLYFYILSLFYSVGIDHPCLKLLRRWNGITQFEQNEIDSISISVLQLGLFLYNIIASSVKRELRGDLFFIFHAKDKAID